MKFLLGKKIAMTQRFLDDGSQVPITVVEAGPCVVTQIKTTDADGYRAVQVGFMEAKKLKKPQKGHLKELGPLRVLREFRLAEGKESISQADGTEQKLERGAVLDVSMFTPGDHVQVRGITKGRGFAGVVKRHHFAGAPATRGHKHDLRAPGSIGATWPQHVVKGRRMAGRMGGIRASVDGVEVIGVVPDEHLILLKGAIPGAPQGLLEILTK